MQSRGRTLKGCADVSTQAGLWCIVLANIAWKRCRILLRESLCTCSMPSSEHPNSIPLISCEHMPPAARKPGQACPCCVKLDSTSARKQPSRRIHVSRVAQDVSTLHFQAGFKCSVRCYRVVCTRLGLRACRCPALAGVLVHTV